MMGFTQISQASPELSDENLDFQEDDFDLEENEDENENDEEEEFESRQFRRLPARRRTVRRPLRRTVRRPLRTVRRTVGRGGNQSGGTLSYYSDNNCRRLIGTLHYSFQSPCTHISQRRFNNANATHLNSVKYQNGVDAPSLAFFTGPNCGGRQTVLSFGAIEINPPGHCQQGAFADTLFVGNRLVNSFKN